MNATRKPLLIALFAAVLFARPALAGDPFALPPGAAPPPAATPPAGAPAATPDAAAPVAASAVAPDATSAPAAAVAPGTAATPAAPANPVVIYPRAGAEEGGSIGFGRFIFADAGNPGSLRLNLRGSWFQLGKFPRAGFDRKLDGTLSLGWTIIRGIEVFAAYDNTSNFNNYTVPHLVQAQGDLNIGAKLGGSVGPMKFAGDIRGALRNGIAADYFTAQTSDFELRGLVNYGIAAGPGSLQIDASGGVVVGRPGPGDLTLRDPRINDTSAGYYGALLFGTGISAYNQGLAAFSLRYEMPSFTPVVGIDFDVPLGVSAATYKLSKTDEGGATAKRVTLGARIQTGNIGALDLALLLGFGTGTTGFSPAEPWTLVLGYSFAFNPGLYRPTPAAAPVVVAPPPAPKPTVFAVKGVIVDGQTGTPVFGVVVTPKGSLPVASGTDGSFTTRDLAPGNTQVTFEREGYRAGVLIVPVSAKMTPLAIRMDPLPLATPPPVPVLAPPPPPPTGFIAGQILGPNGGISADIKISGTSAQVLRSNSEGSFSAKLPAGPYEVLVLPEGYFAKLGNVTVVTDQASILTLHTVAKKPGTGTILDGNTIKLGKPFLLDEKRVAPTVAQLDVLSEVADVLVRSPEKKLIVNVHSDLPKGQKGDRVEWTEARAAAIRQALVEAGVPDDRLEAHGLGTTQPLVSSTSKEAATQNRRVEFTLEALPPKHIVNIAPSGSRSAIAPSPAPAPTFAPPPAPAPVPAPAPAIPPAPKGGGFDLPPPPPP